MFCPPYFDAVPPPAGVCEAGSSDFPPDRLPMSTNNPPPVPYWAILARFSCGAHEIAKKERTNIRTQRLKKQKGGWTLFEHKYAEELKINTIPGTKRRRPLWIIPLPLLGHNYPVEPRTTPRGSHCAVPYLNIVQHAQPKISHRSEAGYYPLGPEPSV